MKNQKKEVKEKPIIKFPEKNKVKKVMPKVEAVKETSKLQDEYEIAYDFATKAYKKFNEIIKSIVLFGSTAKQQQGPKSDIDIIIIVDDASIQWDQELIAWYREELGKIIATQKYKKELHINTVTLSVFWEELKNGEPVIINVLRYGQALIDFAGFFDPLKALLAKRKIRPTAEAIYTTLKRAPIHESRAKISVLNSIEGLYWAMVDSSHAALMAANQIPPSPEHIGEMLNELFVKKKKLDKKYITWYNEMYKLAHDIFHGDVNKIRGTDYDLHAYRVDDFIKKMTDLTGKLIGSEKIIRIEEKKPEKTMLSEKVEQEKNIPKSSIIQTSQPQINIPYPNTTQVNMDQIKKATDQKPELKFPSKK